MRRGNDEWQTLATSRNLEFHSSVRRQLGRSRRGLQVADDGDEEPAAVVGSVMRFRFDCATCRASFLRDDSAVAAAVHEQALRRHGYLVDVAVQVVEAEG